MLLTLPEKDATERRSAAPPLALRDLSVAYDGKPVLWSVDYALPPHGLVAIVGPNGAGKSTLLKAALGLVPRLSGEVRFFGEPLGRVRRDIAYMPQRNAVDWDFPVSVAEVVAMGRYSRLGWLRPVRRADRLAALSHLHSVGLADYADRQIGALSGGQQQRVFLARALAQDARLFLMDEPFAGVDAASEETILAVLQRLEAEGRHVVCVHHDLQTVSRMFDHVLLIDRRVIAAGPAGATLNSENVARAYGGVVQGFALPSLREAGRPA